MRSFLYLLPSVVFILHCRVSVSSAAGGPCFECLKPQEDDAESQARRHWVPFL